jgi:predicted ATP-dependent endonuclease of OLD family
VRDNLILLLDEPGLSLHGKAQGDLLGYFETEIKGVHQLIYTTHSPFMVDPDHFDRVRIVQDLTIDTDEELPEEKQGTKVTTEVLEATGDSLFPLQGALGYELYQTLFVGPNSLVVEGVSDLLYLQVMSGVLERKGRTGLTPEWTITPVGGSDKVPTFVALIGAKKQLNVGVLIDYQKKDRQTIENIWKRKLLDKKKVVTFAEFVTADEADVEDLFEPDFYLHLVSKEYGVPKALKLSDLPPHPRILARLEKHFETKPLPAPFNHYRPARHLVENIAALEGSISAATLDRFEKVFQRVNPLAKR